jgi:hypothetical protein
MADDMSITMDGRRLDTKGMELAFLAEIEAERAARVAGADLTPTTDLTAPVVQLWSAAKHMQIVHVPA